MKICGGTYINDYSRSVGMIGLNDDGCGNFIASQTIISNNAPFQKSTIAMNSYAPNTNYTFNVNGKTVITNGEINKVQDQSYMMPLFYSVSRIHWAYIT